jgi:chaperonin cofactor prefoldin
MGTNYKNPSERWNDRLREDLELKEKLDSLKMQEQKLKKHLEGIKQTIHDLKKLCNHADYEDINEKRFCLTCKSELIPLK